MGIIMDNIIQTIRAPYLGASFLSLLLLTTNITGMESELKQRILTSNSHDTKALIEQSTLEQSTIEDCSICYEEKEVMLIPCKMGEKHPKICKICLNGCNELCPYCRGALMIAKKRSGIEDDIYQCYLPTTYSSHLCLGANFGCLPFYIYLLFTAFP